MLAFLASVAFYGGLYLAFGWKGPAVFALLAIGLILGLAARS
jgi:hypothetical protein